MLALSIRQPWATLIACGYKPIENRNWDTKVRGEILIHAGRAYDYEGHQWVAYHFPDILLPPAGAFPRGGIVGKATLEKVITQSESKWFFGKYGFVMTNAQALPFRPINGQLSFFEVKHG